METILGLEIDELTRLAGGPAYRAKQIFEWLYSTRVERFEEMTNLPQDMRNALSRRFEIVLPEVKEVQQSRDGTSKYALQYGTDVIEAVHMPEERRDTLCLSSQVGCSFGCTFCVTARMNLRRNLTAGEILGQVLRLLSRHGRNRQLNLVFMGMGEPLHNYDAVMKAFRILSHPKGVGISPRHITISTVGLVPALLRLKDEPAIPNLAVSINAPNNELRSQLMPVNRTYPIEVLMDALLQLPLRHRQKITFEYVLLAGVNDSKEMAQQLIRVTAPIRCKINVIPFNPDSHLPYGRPDEETINRFVKTLSEGGRTVSVRRSRGPEISAACGQLGTHYIDPTRIPLALAGNHSDRNFAGGKAKGPL